VHVTSRAHDENTSAKPISVFLMDDHEIVRRGVRDLLEAEPDITVVGEAGTASSALARIPALRPDVAVLDVRLPDGDGVSVCREIRSRMPEVACLMLTSFGDDEALFDAIMAGASGYVLKQIRGTDLVGAIRTVATGQSILDPRAASQLMARLRDSSRKRDPLAELTDQERKILELIGEGLTNRQIGERMYLAEKTVKNYVSGLFAKLGMERRTQAAVYAARIFGEHDYRPGELGPCSLRIRLPAWESRSMRDTGRCPENLSRGECLRLMSTVGVGRMIYTRQALPAVELVNFTLDGGDIVIRTVRDELASAARDSIVAFETDHFSPQYKAGWSVTVIGWSREVARPEPVTGHEHLLHVTPEIVTGHALRLIPEPHPWSVAVAN
jgi:DNA-binding NarL/FixJ family response regulator